jgi:hypothetical protein
MRSKWLEWMPETGFVGFEGTTSADSRVTRTLEEISPQVPAPSADELTPKSAQREPTKPTEPICLRHEEWLFERPSHFWGTDRNGNPLDYYGWRAHVALDAICEIPSPEGLVVWLREHSAFLYRRLTQDLPTEISRAWDVLITHEGFDALCFELVSTYQQAADLYRATAEARKK